MLRTGASSCTSGLLSMAALKIVAAVLGPPGVALLATLQQMRQTAVIAATANGQASLVQGVSARTGVERREYARTALVTFATATAIVALVMSLAPQWAARLSGLGVDRAPLVRWLAVQVAFLSTYIFLTGLMNALGAISKLALVQLIGPGVAALGMLPAATAVASGREVQLPVMLAGAAVAGVAAALWALHEYRPTLAEWFRGAGRWWTWEAARGFFNVSAAMLAGGLAGSAAVMAIRTRILGSQGFAAAGQFDAAWGISMNQVVLVLSSMQTYYLPALARAKHPAERSAQISTVLNLAALVAAPLIVMVTVAKPLVLTLFYSPEFGQAAIYLRWMLIGDYLKISAFILSVPMLASGDMRMYLAAEITGYAVFVAAAALLVRWWPPAESAAIAFVLMYAAHTVFCGIRAATRYRYRPERSTLLVWLAGLALVTAAAVTHWDPSPLHWKSALAWTAVSLAYSGAGALGVSRFGRTRRAEDA
jgi:PST family polysaccharide transporter